MKIIVGGVVSLAPYAPGMAWTHLHYAAGLRRLGHDVVFVEEVDPAWCTDAKGQLARFEQSVNRELFRTTMEHFGFVDRASQIVPDGETVYGWPREKLVAFAQEADLLINISGHVKADFILESVTRRVYVDEDPVYTQLWHAEYGKELGFGRHDVFFTVGLNIGTRATPIPDDGIEWHPLLQPVVLAYWPVESEPSGRRFTTIASWGGFGSVSYQGKWYSAKYEEFQNFAALPGQVGQELEIALRRFTEADPRVQELRANGWFLTEASRIDSLGRYQDYIARSRAEIGIAKNAYVKSSSGWFSDRAGHYLASGRPVLAQATGAEAHLSNGQGLLYFRTLEEAAAGIERINHDYPLHCRAARRFAEEYLDHRKTLPGMLEVATR